MSTKSYVLLYRYPDSDPNDEPLAFVAEVSDDPRHAEEQLLDAEPDGIVVWITNGENVNRAFDEYYSQGEFDDE